MVIKSGKGKIEEIKEVVKEGIIERTDEYKYLGWWFSEANNIRRQLHEIKSRSGYMVREIKIMETKQELEDMMVEYRKCYMKRLCCQQ